MDKGQPIFNVVGKEPEKDVFLKCREMVVGPWVNQPEQYEGYNGFVGWAGVCKLSSGRWLMTFSSGYWHASAPLTPKVLEDEKVKKLCELYRGYGMPNIIAPTGGRSHIIYSDDKGKTWSEPKVLVNTKNDDRHPTILELNDGSLLCTFFDYAFPHEAHSFFMRSTDKGETWTEPENFPGNPSGGFGNGSAFLLDSGRILCSVGETKYLENKEKIECVNIYASDDNGVSFYPYSVVHNIEENDGIVENSISKLNDGRYIFIGRRKGVVRFSSDECKTWSDPYVFGMDIFDPHFIMFPNGVLGCLHGSYKSRALRIILSSDNGQTWNGPEENVGYMIDDTVYGYSHCMLLEDGSAYIVYINNGGHSSHAARTQALFTIRIKPFDNAKGITILSASGIDQETKEFSVDCDDPELGNLKIKN